MPVPSPAPPLKPPRPLVLAVALGVVALIAAGLLLGSAEVPAMAQGGGRSMQRIPPPPADPAALLRRLGVGSVSWYACAMAIVPLWWLAWRLPLTHQRPGRALLAHLAAVLALIAVTAVVHYGVAYRGSPLAPGFLAFAPVALTSSAIPLLAVGALVQVFEARRRAVRQAVDTQRLRAELAESRLAAVTTQLHPHFLFNTLQSISTLIHRDPQAADAVLAKLSDLLRDVLRRSRSGLVPLGDELRMTETYLDLARIRFGERLTVTLDVDDAVRGALVPVLLLQPLVENALKHGVGPRAAGGRLGVSARRHGQHLVIVVWDDGAGLPPGAPPRDGTGLGNTRERLRFAFGDDHVMDLRPRPERGAELTIRMPFRTAGAAAT